MTEENKVMAAHIWAQQEILQATNKTKLLKTLADCAESRDPEGAYYAAQMGLADFLRTLGAEVLVKFLSENGHSDVVEAYSKVPAWPIKED